MVTRASRIASKGDDRGSTVARYLQDIEGLAPRAGAQRKRSLSRVSIAEQVQTTMAAKVSSTLLGEVDLDLSDATNDAVRFRSPWTARNELVRDGLVQIQDDSERVFLGRIAAGPFFPSRPDGPLEQRYVSGFIELLGQLIQDRLVAANSRPAPGARILTLPGEQAANLLGLHGGMVMGKLTTNSGLWLRFDAKSKGVLPRNVGIFGTVGAGKTNTSQVLIEEAARNGWAVIVVDVEGEYIEMDAPCAPALAPLLEPFGRTPEGLADFQVVYPASSASDRKAARAFTLRLADFEPDVIGELLEVTLAERNALLEAIEYFQHRAKTKVETREAAGFQALLDPSPRAKVPFQLNTLMGRVRERGPQSSEQFDHVGLATKLVQLHRAEIMDQNGMDALDTRQFLKAGRVSVVDVSQANDLVRNLVTADLLRKLFVYKMTHEDAAPTLLVLEEAHSFISKERAKTMQATMEMLRTVARRGRKRWLGLAFVSQQPGHLPAEIFELCNTRIVHTVRSLQNLEALMASAGDVDESQWARCPLLSPGEALVSSPQLSRPFVVTMRPAASRRRFAH